MQREPLGLQGQVSEGTQVVGFESGAMTPFRTISFRAFSIWSLYSNGTFCWACCTGGMAGSVLMV